MACWAVCMAIKFCCVFDVEGHELNLANMTDPPFTVEGIQIAGP